MSLPNIWLAFLIDLFHRYAGFELRNRYQKRKLAIGVAWQTRKSRGLLVIVQHLMGYLSCVAPGTWLQPINPSSIFYKITVQYPCKKWITPSKCYRNGIYNSKLIKVENLNRKARDCFPSFLLPNYTMHFRYSKIYFCWNTYNNHTILHILQLWTSMGVCFSAP